MTKNTNTTAKSAAVREFEKLYDRAIRNEAGEAMTALDQIIEAIAQRIGASEDKADADLMHRVQHDAKTIRDQLELTFTSRGALAQIAAFFYDPAEGYRGTYNTLGLQQRVVLGNMIQNGIYQIERAQDYLAQEKHKLTVLVASSDGTEISINNINAQIDRVERIEVNQIPSLQDWVLNLKVAYEAAVGEKWTAPVRRGASPQQQSREAVNERLARLGIKGVKHDTPDYQPQTDGVSTNVA